MSPTARALYWYLRWIHATRQQLTVTTAEAIRESGIPTTSFYRAARELEIEITHDQSRIIFQRLRDNED